MDFEIANMVLNIGKTTQSFDWGNFWVAISAIATTGACIISLWQTKQSNLKKIKLNFCDKVEAITPNDQMGKFISINICNIGNRRIIIKELSIQLEDGSKLILLVNRTTLIPVNLPQALDIEDSIELFFEYDLFLSSIKDAFDKKQINESSKIKFGVRDSSDNYVYIETKKQVQEYLKEFEKFKEGKNDL